MPSCLLCVHLLVRAAAALQSAAAGLDLLAALTEDSALATDALLVAVTVHAEAEALAAVLARHVTP
jgi:uncharacterized RmlC-like cupin family protein